MRFLLFFMTFLAIAFPAFAQCDSGEAALKLGFAEDTEAAPRRRFANAFTDAANTALQGKACVVSIVSNALYDDDKALTAVRSGAIQMAIPRLEKFTVASPKLIVLLLPFAFRDAFALERFIASPAYTSLLQPILQDGLASLGLLHEGFQQMSGSRPIHRPEDVRGMRFRRTDAPDPASQPGLLGATAREVKDGDLAKALTGKLIEAVTGSWSFLAANNVDTVLDGATETNHRYSGFMIVASKELWDTLDGDIRTKLTKAAVDAIAAANTATLATEKIAMGEIIGRDRPVRVLTDKQREAWLERLQQMWQRVEGDEALLGAISSANAMP